MDIDRSVQPEFDSWDSYWKFARRVTQNRRYVWDDQVRRFLDTVLATNRNRDLPIPGGTVWWRAQLGIDYCTRFDVEEPVGFPESRMRPVRSEAREGRANSAGIPVLYVASELNTAISEVRPWVGSRISVARFRITRDLRAINLSVKFGKNLLNYLSFGQLSGDEETDAKTKSNVVWADIDNAFSRPVSLDEKSAEYVPTQILSELFWNSGYDAIAYRSQFGVNGYNLAVLNIDDAEILNCAPYEVSSIEVTSREIGNAWFRRKPEAHAVSEVNTEVGVKTSQNRPI